MGIVRGNHFYLQLITQKRPEYIVGIRPPYLDEDTLTLNTFKILGNQQLREIFHTYPVLADGGSNLALNTPKPLGSQLLRDIYHFYYIDENLVLHTPKLLGSQVLRDIFHEYRIDENTIQHTPKPLGNQQLKFVALVGQNRFDGDEDMDRWKYNPGILGNQELKEIE